jgi:hypothetical protein
LPHRLLQILVALKQAVVEAAYFQAKTVGPQINGCQQSTVFHTVSCQDMNTVKAEKRIIIN